MIVNIDQLTESPRILIEQDSNPTVFNSKRVMLSLPFDEQTLIKGARYMQYFRNKTRNINKKDILRKKYYKIDLGKVSHLHFFARRIILSVFTIITWNCWLVLENCKGDAGNPTRIQLSFNCVLYQKLGLRV